MKKKSGPPKEKTQHTFRIDKRLMDHFRAYSKEPYALRITDLVERGLMMMLEERGVRPDWPNGIPIRFALTHATREEERRILGLCIRMVENEIQPRDKYAEKIAELCFWYFNEANSEPHAEQALAHYFERVGLKAQRAES